MTLVAHNDLPSFERLRREGQVVLSAERADEQDIRPLHVGLLNMMPDAALEATERQFLRLIGASNPISQFFVYPFTIDALPRGASARAHLDRYYTPVEVLREQGLDALIVTGANVTGPDLVAEPFWAPLVELIDWAFERVTSTLCSCLATHAVLRARYGVQRRRLARKRWGVYEHRIVAPTHPLVQGVNTRVSVPHSRFNDISAEQFTAAGLPVLIAGSDAGVQLATSPDGFRMVFFQGHPEYDRISLLKEYKRDLMLHLAGRLDDWPPLPSGYFDTYAAALLDEYRDRVLARRAQGRTPPPLPERLLLERLHNTWHDSGQVLVGNWIGLVYQLTNVDRGLPFMNEVDPEDPLAWRRTHTVG